VRLSPFPCLQGTVDADGQPGHSDKLVMCFGVSLSSLAGDIMATRKPVNESKLGMNEGPEPMFRPEGEVVVNAQHRKNWRRGKWETTT
jgi:hypothetical protein